MILVQNCIDMVLCHTNRFVSFSMSNCEGLFNPLNNLRPKTGTKVRHPSAWFAFFRAYCAVFSVDFSIYIFVSDLCLYVFSDCEIYI